MILECIFGCGTLRCSTKYEASCADPMEAYDIGFIKAINRICSLIRSRKWQREYRRGYVIFLARQAFMFQDHREGPRRTVGPFGNTSIRFLTPLSLTPKQIQKKWAAEKIAYLLERFKLTPKLGLKKIEKIGKFLSQMRNDIVHFGPDAEAQDCHRGCEALYRNDRIYSGYNSRTAAVKRNERSRTAG